MARDSIFMPRKKHALLSQGATVTLYRCKICFTHLLMRGSNYVCYCFTRNRINLRASRLQHFFPQKRKRAGQLRLKIRWRFPLGCAGFISKGDRVCANIFGARVHRRTALSAKSPIHVHSTCNSSPLLQSHTEMQLRKTSCATR